MLSPGGALFRLDIPGVLAANWLRGSLSLPFSGPSPLADCCCNLASMILRCCSLTVILCCRCSFMTGSCVTKPGDKQANPTSWIPSPSLAPNAGRAVAAPEPVIVFLDKSNFRGRCRVVGRTGDPGSFFTIILGAEPPETFLVLEHIRKSKLALHHLTKC